jgi:hypothetical protein
VQRRKPVRAPNHARRKARRKARIRRSSRKILLESTVDSLTCYIVFLSPFSFFLIITLPKNNFKKTKT